MARAKAKPQLPSPSDPRLSTSVRGLTGEELAALDKIAEEEESALLARGGIGRVSRNDVVLRALRREIARATADRTKGEAL